MSTGRPHERSSLQPSPARAMGWRLLSAAVIGVGTAVLTGDVGLGLDAAGLTLAALPPDRRGPDGKVPARRGPD